MDGGTGEVLIATCTAPENKKVLRLQAHGVRILHFRPGRSASGIPIPALLRTLAKLGVQSVLVEGGRSLAGSFFAAGVVDHVVGYISPSLLGSGSSALGPLLGGTRKKASLKIELREVRLKRLGADLRIDGRPVW